MNDERGLSTLTADQMLAGLRTVKDVLAPDLTDSELRLFAMVATRSGLDPWAHQVYAIKRKGRVTFQTGIDGYRSIAARTGMYDGQDEPEFGPWIEKPTGHPEFAIVRVHRKGVEHPISATAYWDEYHPQENDFMWQRMPRVMLSKVAEALALRKAFPYDPEAKHGIGADLYTTEEMAQADRGALPPAAVQSTARERVAMRRKATEDTLAGRAAPAAATDDGRAVDADGVIEGQVVAEDDAFPPASEPVHIPSNTELFEAADAAGIDAKALAKRLYPDGLSPTDPRRIELLAAIGRGEN
jgi:phage recombination protein Bet